MAPKRVLAKLRAIRGVVFVMGAPADVAERSGVRAGGRARKAKPLAGCYAVTVTLATRVEGQRTGLQWIQDTARLVYADDDEEAVELARACCLESCHSMLTEAGRFASITLEGVKDVVPLFDETVLRRVPDGTEIGWRLSRRRLNASRLWRPEHVRLARR